MTYDSMRQFSQLEYGKEKELTYLLNEQHHEVRVADVEIRGSFVQFETQPNRRQTAVHCRFQSP